MHVRYKAVCSVGFLALGAGGCSEYLDRKDTLLLGAGNAVQTNIVTHVVDPWPAHSSSRSFTTSGQRTARAVRRYECGPSQQAAPAQSGININVSAGNTGGGGQAAPTGQG